MNLVIRLDRVYGRTVWYPVNAEAKALAEIAGSKTLTPAVLAIAKNKMGATIQQETPKVEF
jgi:hypothetical protein